MLNRTNAPAYKNITQINVIKANSIKLDNDIPIYTINAGSQELIKLDFIFRAGMYQQPQPLVASCTNSLLECGTKSFSANEISDGIDFFGSFIELQVDQDFATVTVYSLNKYLTQTLRFIEEVIKYPTFLNNELEILITNKKQKHAINSQKVNVLARRKFATLIFGEDHPYGVDVKNEHFDSINTSMIKNFFNQFYNSSNCTIIASGNLPTNLFEMLNTFFGGNDWASKEKLNYKPLINFNTTTQKTHLIEKPDAIQNSIKIGKPLFNKTHPDYFHFQVLNTILGGYFG